MRQACAWKEEVGAPLAEARGPGAGRPVARGRPRVKRVERGQMVLRVVDVAHLIEEDHPARAIWEFVEKLDLSAYRAPIRAVEGVAGREPFDPAMLISLWIYAYSRGIGSAREVAGRCAYEPAFQWLTGLKEVSHHTLSDFRVAHGAALDELFTEALGVLSAEGLVSLERVMHDGTKIRAQAAPSGPGRPQPERLPHLSPRGACSSACAFRRREPEGASGAGGAGAARASGAGV